MLALPGAQQAQTERGQVLATELGQHLAIFNTSEQMGPFVQECLETCILPSIALRDKLLVSKDNFFLNLETFCESGYLDRVEAGQDFYDHLESMVCEDLLFDRKRVNFSMQGTETERQKLNETHKVCAVQPALIMHRIGRSAGEERSTQFIRRQTMIVAQRNRRDLKAARCSEGKGCIWALLNNESP